MPAPFLEPFGNQNNGPGPNMGNNDGPGPFGGPFANGGMPLVSPFQNFQVREIKKENLVERSLN